MCGVDALIYLSGNGFCVSELFACACAFISYVMFCVKSLSNMFLCSFIVVISLLIVSLWYLQMRVCFSSYYFCVVCCWITVCLVCNM